MAPPRRQREESPIAPIYPPIDDGLPVIPSVDLVRSENQLVERIWIASGLDRGEFQSVYYPYIIRLAEFCQLLPLTRDSHYKFAGGAFKFYLEMGFYALQSSEGVLFSQNESGSIKKQMESRWKLAAFITSSASNIYQLPCGMSVIDKTGHAIWSPYESTLEAWAKRHGLTRYFIRWLDQQQSTAKQTVSAVLVGQIVPKQTMDYMSSSELGHRVIESMMTAISGTARGVEKNVLQDLTSKTYARLVERDLKGQASNYGKPKLGAHLEPYIIEAMRELIRTGKWNLNESMGKVYLGDEGVFLMWPLAGKSISEYLKAHDIPGVPQDETLLAMKLVESGMAQAPTQTVDGISYWRICPHKKPFNALKLSDPRVLWPDDMPQDTIPLNLESSGTAPVAVTPPPVSSEASVQGSAADISVGTESTVKEQSPNRVSGVQQKLPIDDTPPESQSANEPLTLESAVEKMETVGRFTILAIAKEAKKGSYKEGGRFHGEAAWGKDLAISIQALSSYGMSSDLIVDSLTQAGWLVAVNGKHKYNVKILGKSKSSVVLDRKFGVLVIAESEV